MKRKQSIILLCILLQACNAEEVDFVTKDDITSNRIVTLTSSTLRTKTQYDGDCSVALWNPNEMIGVTAKCNGNYVGTNLSRFISHNLESSYGASFTGSLNDAGEGEYVYYAVAPYSNEKTPLNLEYVLPSCQNPDAIHNSWDPDCDIMIGKSDKIQSSAIGEGDIILNFNHIVGWLELDFTEYGSSYSSEIVDYVMITSSTPIAGSIIINLDDQTFDLSDASSNSIVASYKNYNIPLNRLKAIITTLPGSYDTTSIIISTRNETNGHIFRLSRNGFVINAGEITKAKIHFCDNDAITEDTIVSKVLPNKPAPLCNLNVLLFGHSFGLDCTEYLPDIITATGLDNVYLGRFHKSNCSLEAYNEFVNTLEPESFYYYSYPPGEDKWSKYEGIKTIPDVLSERPWDIIVLQQSIGFGGAADYDTYQPYLNNLIAYLTMKCISSNNKRPIIGWNMIWGHNSDSKTDYDRNATSMYNDIVDATKRMAAETGIKLIIPVGTTMQNVRNSDLTTGNTKLFTRDGFHASFGIGRYLAACTWYQTIIAPIYGVSIEGNTYRPSVSSCDDDRVTDSRASVIWGCVKEAVAHPY